ncbi:DNA-binding protein [Allohahella marinimesophila]|uniref:KfrA N-terminal DNA-binding domain-containing protein n=1 Tax=Allohahella marinimesophila TaxID=1054972 RepID=A0ABP7QDB5_9GAMM
MSISEKQILESIEFLNSNRIQPTYRAVREHLGAGSNSTIQLVLKAWQKKKDQDRALEEASCPSSISDRVHQLEVAIWRAAKDLARLELEEICSGFDEETASLAAHLDDLDTLRAAAEETVEEQSKEIAALRAKVDQADSERATLLLRVSGLESSERVLRESLAKAEQRESDLAEILKERISTAQSANKK